MLAKVGTRVTSLICTMAQVDLLNAETPPGDTKCETNGCVRKILASISRRCQTIPNVLESKSQSQNSLAFNTAVKMVEVKMMDVLSQKFDAAVVTCSEMDNLCNWCFVSVAPETCPGSLKLDEKDGKSQARESAISKLRAGSSAFGNKGVDLCNLIDTSRENGIDLDALIEQTKALVEKNKKAAKRCDKYRWGKSGAFTFQRIDINRVEIASSDRRGQNIVAIKTTPRRQTQNFGVPPKIPFDLTEIIVEKPGFAGLPDYELFFERSLLLSNDVLKQFLLVFKEHLEQIEMFYKDIDTWLQATEDDKEFMEQTFKMYFDVSLVEPEDDHLRDRDESTHPSTVHPSDASTCASVLDGASCIFSEKEDNSVDGAPAQEDSEDGPEAKSVEGESRKEPKYAIVASFSNTKIAFAGHELILKEYPAEGDYQLTFHIGSPGQKERLVKFIEFLEG